MAVKDFSLALSAHYHNKGNLPKVPFMLNIFDTTVDDGGFRPSVVFRREVSQVQGKFEVLVTKGDIDPRDWAGFKSNFEKSFPEGSITLTGKNSYTIGNVNWVGISKYLTAHLSQEQLAQHALDKNVLGHYVGSATGQVDYYTEYIKAKNDPTDPFIKSLIALTDKFANNLREFDTAKAKLPASIKTQIKASYKKNLTVDGTQFLATLELDTANAAGGGKSGGHFTRLRSIVEHIATISKLSPATAASLRKDKEYQSKLKALLTSADGIKWANMRGSRSLIEYADYAVLQVLRGRTPVKENAYGKTTIGLELPIDYSQVRQLDVWIADLKRKVVATKNTLRTVQLKKRTQTTIGGKFYSLVNLQNLLNNVLHDAIQRNMGTGFRRDILNYRTGRFASTVKVQSLAMQRDGALAVFYTYMKYPYATFAPGGRQGSPRSRDPVILINKSIREIAIGLVTNRLRITSI